MGVIRNVLADKNKFELGKMPDFRANLVPQTNIAESSGSNSEYFSSNMLFLTIFITSLPFHLSIKPLENSLAFKMTEKWAQTVN